MFLYSTKLQERQYYVRKSLAPITIRCTNMQETANRNLSDMFLAFACSCSCLTIASWSKHMRNCHNSNSSLWFHFDCDLECRFTYKLYIQGFKSFSWSYGSVGTLEVWWIEPCLWGGLSELITIVVAITCRVRTENGCVLGIRAPIQGWSWAQDPKSLFKVLLQCKEPVSFSGVCDSFERRGTRKGGTLGARCHLLRQKFA